MKVKEGDILYCKKKRFLFRKDKYPEFTDGKVYVVEEVKLPLNNGEEFKTGVLYIVSEQGFIQLYDSELGNYSEILKTSVEMRKIKLDRLSSK